MKKIMLVILRALLTTLEGLNNEKQALGSDRDEYGCIRSAGYMWCEKKQECIRPWEVNWAEDCEVNNN